MKKTIVALALILMCSVANAGLLWAVVGYAVGKHNADSKAEYFPIYASKYEPAQAGSIKMEVVQWYYNDTLQHAVWDNYPHIKWEDVIVIMQGKDRRIFVYYCTDKKVERKK